MTDTIYYKKFIAILEYTWCPTPRDHEEGEVKAFSDIPALQNFISHKSPLK